MNYWYSANNCEIFLDLDNYTNSIEHIRKRLQGAIECEKLPIEFVKLWKSAHRESHYHAVVVLKHALPYPQRVAWSIVFHSDIYRASCNLMRYSKNIPNPDILIGNQQYHRRADAICYCHGKHSRVFMETCPAAKELRGRFRFEGFFGKPSKKPCTIL